MLFKGFQQASQHVAVHLESAQVSAQVCVAQPRITQDGRKLIGMTGRHWREARRGEDFGPGSSAMLSAEDFEQPSDYQRCVLTSCQLQGCPLQPKPGSALLPCSRSPPVSCEKHSLRADAPLGFAFPGMWGRGFSVGLPLQRARTALRCPPRLQTPTQEWAEGTTQLAKSH